MSLINILLVSTLSMASYYHAQHGQFVTMMCQEIVPAHVAHQL